MLLLRARNIMYYNVEETYRVHHVDDIWLFRGSNLQVYRLEMGYIVLKTRTLGSLGQKRQFWYNSGMRCLDGSCDRRMPRSQKPETSRSTSFPLRFAYAFVKSTGTCFQRLISCWFQCEGCKLFENGLQYPWNLWVYHLYPNETSDFQEKDNQVLGNQQLMLKLNSWCVDSAPIPMIILGIYPIHSRIGKDQHTHILNVLNIHTIKPSWWVDLSRYIQYIFPISQFRTVQVPAGWWYTYPSEKY